METKDIEKKAIEHITKSFLKCLEEDIYPADNYEGVFGIEMTQTTEILELECCTMGNLTANVWLELYHHGSINEGEIKDALATGTLPKYYEEKVRKMFADVPAKSPFSCELLRRGFTAIPWDVDTLAILSRPFTSSSSKEEGKITEAE